MAAVANLFKSPPIPQALPAPTPDTKPVQQAAADTAARRARARGYRSTILSQMTDAAGLTSQNAPNATPSKTTFGA